MRWKFEAWAFFFFFEEEEKVLHLQLGSSLIFDGKTVSLKEKDYKNVSLAFSNTHKGADGLFIVASYSGWDALKVWKENAEKKEINYLLRMFCWQKFFVCVEAWLSWLGLGLELIISS